VLALPHVHCRPAVSFLFIGVVLSITTTVQGSSFVTTYSLQKGLQQFGDRAKQATLQEMQQLHVRKCFQPIHKKTLSNTERSRALESIIFLVEKLDGNVKARHCANGSTQRNYMQREDVSSPTVCTDSVLMTAVIEAEENRDVATCDIPNAFIQTDIQTNRCRWQSYHYENPREARGYFV
jgi:hypothetical protein